MSIYRMQKMQPRNGHTLNVLLTNRISGCVSQKEVSLEDQEDHGREVVKEVYDGESAEFRVISTKGKGECLTRPELTEIEAMIRTRELDLIVLEDIGRLVRGTEANRFCGIAVDHGVRLISIHDGIDTWEEGWEEDVIAACRDHVGHNIHTSRRIKKKLMLRFKRSGAATPCPIAGYIKPKDAKSFHDWSLDLQMRPFLLEGARQLLDHANCSAVADYFNAEKLPVGPYCRNEEWDGSMVRRFYANPILKGKPERGNKHSVKHHETGKRRCVKNPEGPVSIDLPHLAILSDDEFNELNALLTAKNSAMGRKPYANGLDPLMGIPRKRTRFPGQHGQCWYCGRILVWGANGMVNHLQCTGARQYKCWNSVGIPGGRLTELVVDAVWTLLDRVINLDKDLFEIAATVAKQPSAQIEARLSRLINAEIELSKEQQNLLQVMTKFGPSEIVENGLKQWSEKKLKLQMEKSKMQRQVISAGDIPASATELKNLVQSKFLDLARDSFDFGQLFPKIVPELFVYCVRLANYGPLLSRVKFTVDLSKSFEGCLPDDLQQHLISDFTVDLFDRPCHDIIRDEVVRLYEDGQSKKTIRQTFNGTVSLRMINKALELQQRLRANQIDPYVLQHEPPADLPKFRRHRHSRYEFKMKDNYQRCEL